jgi:RNA polymerase sigma-70 factor (ECF subfamily)
MTEDTRTKQFLALYTDCQRQLYAYIRSQIPFANEADDLVQEVSVVLWEKFDSYRPDESFVRWACGIARMKILQYRQDRQKRGRVALGLDEELVDLVIDETLKISETADVMLEALQKCMEKLSPWDMVILRERLGTDKSVKQIAQAFGRTESAVYKTLRGIYDSLYDCIQVELAQKALR